LDRIWAEFWDGKTLVGKQKESRLVKKYLTPAIEIAKAAGDVLREGVDKIAWVEHKGEINLVTEIDIKSEKLIKQKIGELFPDHDIMAEESDTPESQSQGRSQFKWIVDPVDGTTNYAHGFPMFCVSMALEVEGIVELGVVYDPMRDELFTAVRGGGGFLNGKPIEVSAETELGESLVATGFPYDLRTSEVNNLDNWNTMIFRVRAVRRAGSAALDLCYTAMGRFDGFWELKLHPWDVAAGGLIVEEAGGMVTDLGGDPHDIYSQEILASNGKIHSQMSEILKLGKRPPATSGR
jgi:myo-inositol-1(or 4)-monophosphatase